MNMCANLLKEQRTKTQRIHKSFSGISALRAVVSAFSFRLKNVLAHSASALLYILSTHLPVSTQQLHFTS